MRTLSALLMVLLLCSLQQVYCRTEGIDIEDCCHKLTVLRKLPLARIESHRWTSSNCPIKAVVFQMDTGKSFCADPSWNWVESHIKELDKKKAVRVQSAPSAACRGQRRQGIEGIDSMKDCCHKLTKLRKLPLARIESYSLTSSKCDIKAVVFQMDTGKSFCVDPSLNWVRSHMKKLDQKKASTAAKL